MLMSFGRKRAPHPSDGPDNRDELLSELMDLQELISEHRAESTRIYEDYDRQQTALEMRLSEAYRSGSDDAIDAMKSEIDELRATRVAVALPRTEELREMRRREQELESMLGIA